MSANFTKGLVAAVAGVLLMLPTGAFGATYGGSLKKGGKIGIGVSVEGGQPQHVKDVTFKKFPATCQSSAHRKITGSFKYEDPGLEVNGGEFKTESGTVGTSPYVFHKGHFKNSAHKLVGKLRVTVNTRFHDGHTEDCTSKKSWYVTHRGAPAPGSQQPAKLAALIRAGSEETLREITDAT
jgi:hypothetical protein